VQHIVGLTMVSGRSQDAVCNTVVDPRNKKGDALR
jgi:hypothetical protein